MKDAFHLCIGAIIGMVIFGIIIPKAKGDLRPTEINGLKVYVELAGDYYTCELYKPTEK